jgi:hypothetical protein
MPIMAGALKSEDALKIAGPVCRRQFQNPDCFSRKFSPSGVGRALTSPPLKIPHLAIAARCVEEVERRIDFLQFALNLLVLLRREVSAQTRKQLSLSRQQFSQAA